MKTKLFLILITFLLINFVAAQSFCVDFDKPSAPSNLILTAFENNIQLNWNSAIDEPECSGISHYDIYRGFNGGSLSLINNSEDTSYLDENLDYGTYTYIIHAWDLAGHNEGNGVSNSIVLKLENKNNGNGGSSSGGGGNNYFSSWRCEEWSKCVNKTQERVCVDLKGKSSNMTETKTCFSDFVPIIYENNDSKSNLNESIIVTPTGYLTGAVTGITKFAKSGKGISLIFIILIGGLFTAISIFKRKMNKIELKNL